MSERMPNSTLPPETDPLAPPVEGEAPPFDPATALDPPAENLERGGRPPLTVEEQEWVDSLFDDEPSSDRTREALDGRATEASISIGGIGRAIGARFKQWRQERAADTVEKMDHKERLSQQLGMLAIGDALPEDVIKEQPRTWREQRRHDKAVEKGKKYKERRKKYEDDIIMHGHGRAVRRPLGLKKVTRHQLSQERLGDIEAPKGRVAVRTLEERKSHRQMKQAHRSAKRFANQPVAGAVRNLRRERAQRLIDEAEAEAA